MSQFYRRAGRILKDFEGKKGSLKSLIFTSASTDLRTKKKLYAILCKTLKYKDVLQKVINSCGLVQREPKVFSSYHLCLVLVCDVLYGRGLRCGGILKSAMQRHINELKAAWKSVTEMLGPRSMCSMQLIPKYVRINTLKDDVGGVLCDLRREGFTMGTRENICSCSCLSQNSEGLMKDCFCCDDVIPELLMFCHCTDIVHSTFYLDSRIIIQDKASCLPAYVLSPATDSHVIDACAAPGNKTTHLSSIMKNGGLIYAFDKDPKRYKTLQLMVNQAGATNVILQCADFLTVDPGSYEDVTAVLVDPSCSGSGIYSRMNYDTKEPKDVKRLTELSKFQEEILNHALRFPAVQQVVYSTCSIHKEENEYVVRNSLLKHASSFELVHILPNWPSRGLPVFTKGIPLTNMAHLPLYPCGVLLINTSSTEYLLAECCIRASADNKTNGFFVAMFKRKQQWHIQ